MIITYIYIHMSAILRFATFYLKIFSKLLDAQLHTLLVRSKEVRSTDI